MFEWIGTLTGGQVIGFSSLALVISGLILKHTGILKKLRGWADSGSKYLGKLGYNIGVLITTKANDIPVLGLFWENLIEPSLAIICELIPGIIFEFFNSLTNGLKSDNKEFKK